jgi:hypothetical protein
MRNTKRIKKKTCQLYQLTGPIYVCSGAFNFLILHFFLPSTFNIEHLIFNIPTPSSVPSPRYLSG